jgi:DNA repair photolyase
LSGAAAATEAGPVAGLGAALLLAATSAPLAARLDDPDGLALVRRAVGGARRRARASLESYRTRAHGFVSSWLKWRRPERAARLVKADRTAVEVYWQAPDRSKQVILGWRDGAYLPPTSSITAITWVSSANDFGDVIRIGETTGAGRGAPALRRASCSTSSRR